MTQTDVVVGSFAQSNECVGSSPHTDDETHVVSGIARVFQPDEFILRAT
jgi:hypothetical protein